MKKELAALLSRAEADQTETSQNAIRRLLKLVWSEQEARQALFGLLSSSRLAVVSSACRGLHQLLENEDGADKLITFSDASDQLVKALEIAVAHEGQQRSSPQGGVTQCLTRCLVATCRARLRHARQRQQPTRGEGEGVAAGAGLDVMATLLSLNRGQLYPALAHEATCFVSRFDVDRREVVGVVGALASTLLLQPEYANLRGGFLLKLSTASASSGDAVKLCLVLLQAELLGFSAMRTPAHADLAAGWCCSLVNTALSLDSDASWERASRAIGAVAIFLLSEFRERGVPIAPLLDSLRSMVVADPLCLAEEVAFLGIAALQSQCIDEREALLDIVARTLVAMPLRGAPGSEEGGRAGDVDVRVQTWSLETLVYPSVSMAAAGNAAAARALPLIEAALDSGLSLANVGTRPGGAGKTDCSKPARHASAVALGVRRLGLLEDGDEAVLAACEGLRVRASELLRADGGAADAAADAPAVADLECGLCLLAPLLLRPHRQAHGAASAALVAVVRAVPALGVRLLPFVLYAIRKLGGAALEDGSVVRLLHVLPELGAHKFAAKPVAGVVQALAKAPQAAVRGVGLRLAAALVQVNSRTFNQLQALLVETPADHVPPMSPEPDESRLCRAAGMLEICEADPELGLACVRPLQAFLGDSSPAVTAVALRAIAALCRGDCLDFDAALRIVTKKGKVAHTGRRDSSSGEEFGDPRVMESMAQLCGAGAEAAASAAAEASETGSDDDDDDDDGAGMAWGMGSALSILLERGLASHPDESVRSAVYTALGAHLPALLRAATGKETDEEAVAAAPRVREFLGLAMSSDGSSAARPSLERAASIVLAEESVDPSTWVSSKRAGASRARGKEGSDDRSGPSNRLLAALPPPESVLLAFRQDGSSCPGLAGAVLWCYPALAPVPAPEAAAVAVAAAAATAAVTAAEHRDAMIRDFGELMMVEGTSGGLAMCPWQRAGTPPGVQRYVARLLAACLAAESAEAGRRGEAGAGSEVTLAAVEACREAIASFGGVQAGLVAVASASLASCVPASFSHVAVEEAGRAVERLRSSTGGSGGGTTTLLDGEEFFPLSAAMAVRALPETSAEQMGNALGEIERFHSTAGGGTTTAAGGDSASDPSTPNEAAFFWSCVAVGVASEWSLRHPKAPEARGTALRAVRRLLTGIADTVGSDHVAAIAESLSRGGAKGEPRLDRAAVVGWESVDVGHTNSKMGVPTTPWGSRCLGLLLGLSSTLPGLRATGLHLELLQVFNIVRALALRPATGLCGASICLAAAASECLSCGLVDGPVVLSCLRSVSLSLDASASPAESGEPPAQDTCLGAAGLVAVCEGRVVLPPGFAESMFDSLRKAAAHRRGADSGVRVASLLALAWLVGCPLLDPGGLVPRRMRVASVATRRMVETLSQDILGRTIHRKPGLTRGARVDGGRRNLGSFAWGGGGRVGGAGAIAPDALCVAREGTLMGSVLTGLQSVATGLGDAEDGGMEEKDPRHSAPVRSSLFAASTLACLESCSCALRVPHPQMAVVIEALFRGGHGVAAQKGAVQLALALADKERAYSAWLRGLFHKPLFVNLPQDLRRHLVSVVGQVFSKLPSETGNGLVSELWDTITSRLFVPWSSASGSEQEGGAKGGSEGIRLATAFFLAMEALGQDPGIESMALTSFVPSILRAFSARGDVTRFDSDPHEAPFWNSLAGLLSRFPWEHVRDAIASKPKRAVTTETAGPSDRFDQTVREYLTSRLAPVGEARSAPPAEASSRSSPPPAPSAAAARMLGSVARWGTRVRTTREASAAVLPRLAARLKPIGATESGGKWLLTLLDAAELPESCPVRATALVGGATAVWEPWNTGHLVVGETADELLGRGLCDGGSVGSINRRGALFYSMGVTAPRAVMRAETSSPGLSTEVLARLFRLSGLLQGRIRGASDEREVAELDDVRFGLECFIRGLRHAPGVLSGTQSRSLALYAESVATGHALS
eukprot:g1851.t1